MSKFFSWKLIIAIACAILLLTPGKMVWAGQSFQTVPTVDPNPTKSPAPATATATHRQPKSESTAVVVPPAQPTALPTETPSVEDSINEPTPSPIATLVERTQETQLGSRREETVTAIPEAKGTAVSAAENSPTAVVKPGKEAQKTQGSIFAFWPIALLFVAGIVAVFVVAKKFLFH